MFDHIKTASPRLKQHNLSFFIGVVASLMLTMLLSSAVHAAAPPAGSTVSNQATASYTDGSGAIKTATSNVVVTTITQVAALSLVTDNFKTAVAGSTVYMPHTLTNLGNAADSFNLPIGATGGGFALTGLAIYLDSDANGVPDNTTPLCTGAACTTFTTPSLAANGTYSFILATQVPAGATDGQIGTVQVSANSVFTPTITATNTDTVTVTAGPAFNVTKRIDIPSGAKSGAACVSPYTDASCIKVKYTLTYTNTGAAGNLYLKDVLGLGATVGMGYVPGSARWSNAPSTALTDATGETATGIDFLYEQTSGNKTIEAVIANVGSGVTGTVSFDVAILNTAAIGTSSTTNTAAFGVEAGTTVPTTAPTTTNTNPSPYLVGNVFGVVTNNSSSLSTVGVVDAIPLPTDEPSDDANLVFGNGATTIAANTAAPGATVSFENYIWNTGSSTDTFNISLAVIDAFPPNTVFQLFKADGATTLADSNSDGFPDTGPINPDSSYKVIVKAIIPAAACTPTCPTGPFTQSVTATSVADGTKFNLAYDRLSSLSPPQVDLTNSVSGTSTGTGADLGPFVAAGATPTTTKAVAAGATTGFPLFVKNGGTASDNYNLEFSNSNFVAGTVPSAGWTVVFRTAVDLTCTAATGSVITNTGNVNASGQVQVCAFVTTTSTSAAATYNVYFRAISGATGVSDVKLDAVTINDNAKLTLTPNGSGQVFPGGSITYPHDLTNTGNLACTADSTFNLSNVLPGWSAILYNDVNGNGVIDTGDVVLGSHNGSVFAPGTALPGPLAIGATRKLLMRVIAPAGASAGDTDNITIGVSHATCGTATANDATLVITGQLRLDKVQALDIDCNGADSAFATTALQAKPGECIVYQVTATNSGTTDVTAVTVNDSTPTFTSYNSTAAPLACSQGALTPLAPITGYVGALSCGPIGTMIPGATAVMTFGVKVNQ